MHLEKRTVETSRKLATSLSTDCDAVSKAVVDFETAVSMVTRMPVVQVVVADGWLASTGGIE